MTVPPVVAALLVELVLVLAALLVFLPDPPPLPRRRQDVERLAAKYGPWFVPIAIVVVVHLLEIHVAEPRLAARLGYDLGPRLAAADAPVSELLAANATGLLDGVASAWVVLVQPAVVVAAILLFTLTDEERAARASLLALPLAYAVALPLFLFAPATDPTLVAGRPSPLFDRFPDLAGFWYSLAAPDNTVPAFQVALAALVANAARYSRNRRFRLFAMGHAAALPLATLYLGLTYVAAVLAAFVVAAVAALYVRRAVDVERLALQRVRPAPEEAQRIREDGEALVARVAATARELGHADATPMLVGSVAKDTYLRDRVDYDVFVLFPPDTPRAELEKAGVAVGRAALTEPMEKYAEHPYVHGLWRGRQADVVPAYRLADASERMTAVDRTPFHTAFVLRRMDRDGRDETRLLKAFLVGIGAYGAESRTRGFSGYLCELLTIKYGSFRAVVAAGARFQPGTYLVVQTVEGNRRFQDPLVVLDPVDPRRNAASAVSEETLATFAEACRAYLARQGLAFFFPRALLPLAPDRLQAELRRRKLELVLLRMPRPDALEDHLHDQLRKAARAASELLERHGFEVRRATTQLAAKEGRILLELRRLKLSEGEVHAGPPLDEVEHAARFRAQWEGKPDALSPVYEEDGRLKVKRRRRFRRADELLRDRLPGLDLGAHFGPAARRALVVQTGAEAATEDTALLLTRHLDRRRPWER